MSDDNLPVPETRLELIQHLRAELAVAIALIEERDRRGMATDSSTKTIAAGRHLLKQPIPRK